MSDDSRITLGIDADDFVEKDEDKRRKEWTRYATDFESVYFPPYVLEMNPKLQDFLKANMVFTYSKSGKPLIYRRVPDLPGTVWTEFGDAEKPFSTIQGRLRNELSTVLSTTCEDVTVTLIANKSGKLEMMHNVPKYTLYLKFLPQILAAVRGKPENVETVKKYIQDKVGDMQRRFESKLYHSELAHGMQRIPKMLENMDQSLDSMGFMYMPEVNFPALTNDPKEPAFAYFDLSTITDGPTPDFDGLMLAIEPACLDSLKAAIYATFFAKSSLSHYIWIKGEGGDGKTSLLDAIARFAGDNLACAIGQNLNSAFVLENAINKRVVLFSDVKSGLSVKSGLMHSLTGHDPVDINRKNRPAVTVRLNPIVWVAANCAPDVNFANRNERRRCLYIQTREPPEWVKRKFYFVDDQGNFIRDAMGEPINNGYDLVGGLVREMPHILYKCRASFERLCPPPYRVILQSHEQTMLAINECVDIDANEWSTYINETFEFTNKRARMRLTEIHEQLQETMHAHSDKTQLSNFAKRDIVRMLCAAYRCTRKTVDGIRYLQGISLRSTPYAPEQEEVDTVDTELL